MKLPATLLYLFLLLSQIVICYLQPYHNWDMLGYIGCAISMEEKNVDSIHAKTFRAVKSELSQEDFETLTQSNEYRKKNFSSAEFFHDQLKLYWVKPLYVVFIFLLWKTGFPLLLSTLIPSLLALLCIGILLFHWIKIYLTGWWAAIVSILMMLSPPLWEIGRYATPDALAGLGIFVALYFLYEIKNKAAATVILVLSIFIRIDLALLCMIIIGFLTIVRDSSIRLSKQYGVVAAGFVIFIVVAITFFSGNYGAYLTDYYTPAEESVNPFTNYFLKLAKFLPQLRYSTITIFMAVFMIASVKKIRDKSWQQDTAMQLSLMLLIYIMIRFLVFPSIDDRFYVAIYLFLFVIAVKEIVGKQSMEA